MLPIWLVILLDIAVVYFFFGNNIANLLRTKAAKRRFMLKGCVKQYRALLRRDRDIITTAQADALRTHIADLDAARKSGDPAKIEAALAAEAKPSTRNALPPPKPYAWIREHLEVAVVAIGLAFGLRALFIQPFKIPTGSMQPTLYGVHYIADNKPLHTGFLHKFFSYMNYSCRNMELTVKENGYLDFNSFSAEPSYPLLPTTGLTIGTMRYKLPGAPDRVQRILYEEALEKRTNLYMHAGESLLHGHLSLGDHLFVNRTSLCFREPRRGDVMVFVTDGLVNPDGRGFGGRFYIKRLVGLPGDELLIRDHKLLVREPGATSFRVLDETDDPGFARVHSCRGYYHGYANMPGSQYLRNGNDIFKVPEGHYFMLGDNSENSLDSRYWGTVPRQNLVGTALVVWWPFSRRWGTVDRVEPLPIDTPPKTDAL